MLQQRLVIELLHRGEPRASKWYDETWTEERGNYTNVAAGYVGNPNSGGIENGWKYLRRDTVGSPLPPLAFISRLITCRAQVQPSASQPDPSGPSMAAAKTGRAMRSSSQPVSLRSTKRAKPGA